MQPTTGNKKWDELVEAIVETLTARLSKTFDQLKVEGVNPPHKEKWAEGWAEHDFHAPPGLNDPFNKKD